jgi:hypothetical protein
MIENTDEINDDAISSRVSGMYSDYSDDEDDDSLDFDDNIIRVSPEGSFYSPLFWNKLNVSDDECLEQIVSFVLNVLSIFNMH